MSGGIDKLLNLFELHTGPVPLLGRIYNREATRVLLACCTHKIVFRTEDNSEVSSKHFGDHENRDKKAQS